METAAPALLSRFFTSEPPEAPSWLYSSTNKKLKKNKTNFTSRKKKNVYYVRFHFDQLQCVIPPQLPLSPQGGLLPKSQGPGISIKFPLLTEVVKCFLGGAGVEGGGKCVHVWVCGLCIIKLWYLSITSRSRWVDNETWVLSTRELRLRGVKQTGPTPVGRPRPSASGSLSSLAFDPVTS